MADIPDSTKNKLIVEHFKQEISNYEKDKEFEKWHTKRGPDVYKRYLDDRADNVSESGVSKFNILWSNVQTLSPAVYSKIPKPDVTRRYNDRDPVGRVASTILERCIEFEIEYYKDFDSGIRAALKDRLLPGRGTAWVRYEPAYGQKPVSISEDDEGDYIDSETGSRFNYTDEDGEKYEDENVTQDDEGNYSAQYLESERTYVDYVQWEDFGHSVARTWEEVDAIWRRVYLDKSEIKKRFGDVASKFGYEIENIPFAENENTDQNGKKTSAAGDSKPKKKTCVYEIWDRGKKRS
jgi:hypothetical protein